MVRWDQKGQTGDRLSNSENVTSACELVRVLRNAAGRLDRYPNLYGHKYGEKRQVLIMMNSR